MRFARAALAAVAILGIGSVWGAGPVAAQPYPDHAVKVVVTFSPGSGIDIVAREVSDKLSKVLGQPFVVENRAGAGGTIAEAVVAKSPPDGYTLLVNSSSHAANSLLYANLPYDPLKDLVPVTPLAVLPNVLVVKGGNPKGINSVPKLVAYAKAHPGQLTFASSGVGSATHMNALMFNVRAGIRAIHVPFRGTPEAMNDVMGGRVDYMFTPMNAAIALIKSGKLEALSVAAAQRSPELPNIPTTSEAGVPNSDYIFWTAMFVPAKTPQPVVGILYDATRKILATPEMKAEMGKLGATPYSMKSDVFQAVIAKNFAENKELVEKAGLKPN